MTDSAFILKVLEDGQPHSQAEILRLSFNERGCGLTVHSRIADLRKKGHYIVCDRIPNVQRGEAWTYQLLGSLPESPLSVASSPHDAQKARISTVDGRGDSESEQTLFTYPRSPSWA